LAEERSDIYNGKEKKAAREAMLCKWQRSWESPSEKGRWTYRLIKDGKPWFQRKHGEVSFHLCQVLTNHGCFNKYLRKYGKRGTDECAHCGSSPDSAEHAVFLWDAWYHWRREACVYLEVDQLTPDNIVGIMLESKRKWLRIENLLTKIMMCREEEERRVQHGSLVQTVWSRIQGREVSRTDAENTTSKPMHVSRGRLVQETGLGRQNNNKKPTAIK
jgi:hypothetical protein